jgi:hypothetical protein
VLFGYRLTRLKPRILTRSSTERRAVVPRTRRVVLRLLVVLPPLIHPPFRLVELRSSIHFIFFFLFLFLRFFFRFFFLFLLFLLFLFFAFGPFIFIF